MSILVSDGINELQQETKTDGERITETDFLLAFKRANQYLNSTYKMPTTQRDYQLLVYPGVYEYASPSDFIGWADLDRGYNEVSPKFQHQSYDELIHDFNGRKTAFKFNRETLFLIVKDDVETGTTIHDCDSNSTNGVWSISGDSSSISVDEQIYTQGSASLKFTTVFNTGVTTLVNSTITQVDLTDFLTTGRIFLDLNCPTSTALTSVRLRIGSDSTNYYESTATTRHNGSSISYGTGLISFSLPDATTTGSPVSTACDYIQIVITAPTGTSGIYRLDNIFVANPTYYNLPYYSQNNVKDISGSYKQHPTATDDTILCPADADNAIIYKAMEWCAVQILKDLSMAQTAARELKGYEQVLRKKYPSSEKTIHRPWYRRFK